MYVKLVKPWKACRPGKIFSEMPANVAELLIKRGIAKKISKPKDGEAADPNSTTDETGNDE